MIVGVPDAGFEPLPGPPFTAPQDILAEIGTGPPAWTVLAAAAPVSRRAYTRRVMTGGHLAGVG
jgi:hypothetical protein